MQHDIQMDLTASCLSCKIVEVDGDASQSTMSLCNSFQFEAVPAIQLTQTYLTLFLGTRIQTSGHNPTDVPTDINQSF
jgi:hypothetical protein